MKIANAGWHATGTVAAFALAGCAGGSQAVPSSSPLQGAFQHISHHPTTVSKSDRRASWMAPDARRQALLYVSDDGTNDVYAFSYPKGKLEGTLTGFSFPEGECVDKKGDVFIANNDASTILKYAHGGTTPIATLSDAGYFPTGCSVNPKTGDLAVANTYNTSFTAGSVAIYKGASGNPTEYTDTVLVYPHLCGYDPQGNLYVDGFTSGFSFQFAVLPKKRKSFTDLTLNQAIGFPGAVQWDGQHIAVGDADRNTIYQFTISGSAGTEVGSTSLSGSRDVAQFWIQAAKVIGPDTLNADVGIWNYPAGGTASKVIGGLGQPYGSTVSKGT